MHVWLFSLFLSFFGVFSRLWCVLSSLVCGVSLRWVAALLSRQAPSARGGRFAAASQRHLFSSLCACPVLDYLSIHMHVLTRSAMAWKHTVCGTAHFIFSSSRRMLSLVVSAVGVDFSLAGFRWSVGGFLSFLHGNRIRYAAFPTRSWSFWAAALACGEQNKTLCSVAIYFSAPPKPRQRDNVSASQAKPFK